MHFADTAINKSDRQNFHVAVIGAGVSGLAAIRHLLKAGIRVTCFEKNHWLGGLWHYQPTSPVDIRYPHERPKTPIYKNLRTNFPVPCMMYPDFQEFPKEEKHPQQRMFPGKASVENYLKSYARTFDLEENIAFGCTVTSLSKAGDLGWLVQWQQDDGKSLEQLFNKVVICTGHYNKPTIPKLSGLESFSGLVTHSLYYREPETFKGQNIAVLGASNSGDDISHDLSAYAKQVYFCGRFPSGSRFISEFDGHPYGEKHNITQHAEIIHCNNRELTLSDGSKLNNVDALILATGFEYEFLFLKNLETIGLTLGDRYLSPLYMDTFHANDPSLAFVGLPSYAAIFWLVWYQAAWIARVFTGQRTLPSPSAMIRAVQWQEQVWRDSGISERNLQRYKERMFPQIYTLSRLSGERPFPSQAEKFTLKGFQHIRDHSGHYRDIHFSDIPSLHELGFR